MTGSIERCSIPPYGWVCSRAAGHDGPCAATKDHSHAFGFEGGHLLTHPDGSGQLWFYESEIEYEEEEGKTLVVSAVPRSELIELRDHLNKLFPIEGDLS